jgi:hypothetical protein
MINPIYKTWAFVAVAVVGCSGASAVGPGSGAAAGGPAGQAGECMGDYKSCSKAEIDTFLKCSSDRCGDKYATCYGPDYMSGAYSGPCAESATCQKACACDDSACQAACPRQPIECTTCLGPFALCVQSECGFPTCMMAAQDGGAAYDGAYDGAPTGTKTCGDLVACCASLADASKRATCEKQYDAVKGYGDTVCNSVYQSYAMQGLCK